MKILHWILFKLGFSFPSFFNLQAKRLNYLLSTDRLIKTYLELSYGYGYTKQLSQFTNLLQESDHANLPIRELLTLAYNMGKQDVQSNAILAPDKARQLLFSSSSPS